MSDAPLVADLAALNWLRRSEGRLVLIPTILLQHGLDRVKLIVELIVPGLAQLVAHFASVSRLDAKLECSLWHHLLVAFVLLQPASVDWYTWYGHCPATASPAALCSLAKNMPWP